jgi:hypothetical protein
MNLRLRVNDNYHLRGRVIYSNVRPNLDGVIESLNLDFFLVNDIRSFDNASLKQRYTFEILKEDSLESTPLSDWRITMITVRLNDYIEERRRQQIQPSRYNRQNHNEIVHWQKEGF